MGVTRSSQELRRNYAPPSQSSISYVLPDPLCLAKGQDDWTQLMRQEIVDTSGNCGGSYSVVVVSPDFRKKMTLARHKLGKCICHDIRQCGRLLVVNLPAGLDSPEVKGTEQED